MSKETGFYERLATLTDHWMDLFGYLAPSVVTDVADEYRAVRETAGLMDFTMLRKVDLEGPGALELVNSVVGRDVSKLQQGRIAYGPLVDEYGKMVDDCTVMLRSPDRVRFFVDDQLVRAAYQRIDYPLQLMVDLFEFPAGADRELPRGLARRRRHRRRAAGGAR